MNIVDKRTRIDNFICDKIAKGMYAMIYTINPDQTLIKNPEKKVLKFNTKDKESSGICCLKEYDILRKVRGHEFFVELCGGLYLGGSKRHKEYETDNLHFVFIREKTNLHLWIKEREEKRRHRPLSNIEMNDIMEIGYKLAIAIEFLHRSDIIHCDLKPDNVLFDPSTKNIYLTDFGLSYFQSSADPQHGKLYADRLRPPEVSESLGFNFKSDVYVFGIIIFYLFIGNYPHNPSDCDDYPLPRFYDRSLIINRYGQDYQFLLNVESNDCDIQSIRIPNIKKLIYSCLNPINESRPFMHEILSLNFLEDFYRKFISVINTKPKCHFPRTLILYTDDKRFFMSKRDTTFGRFERMKNGGDPTRLMFHFTSIFFHCRYHCRQMIVNGKMIASELYDTCTVIAYEILSRHSDYKISFKETMKNFGINVLELEKMEELIVEKFLNGDIFSHTLFEEIFEREKVYNRQRFRMFFDRWCSYEREVATIEELYNSLKPPVLPC